MKKLSIFLVYLILSGAGSYGAEQQLLHDRPYSKLETDILNKTTLEELKKLEAEKKGFCDAVDELIQRGESPLIVAITIGNLETVTFFSSCCRGILKNEGVPTPFQLALKLSSMKEQDHTLLFPKSPHRRAILDLFIKDPEVIAEPISRNCWPSNDEGDRRYLAAMNCLIENILVIKSNRSERRNNVRQAIVDSGLGKSLDNSVLDYLPNVIVDFACPQDKLDFSDYDAPKREWFSPGDFGTSAYRDDQRGYQSLRSGRQAILQARAEEQFNRVMRENCIIQ